jgi:hypothetical protein
MQKLDYICERSAVHFGNISHVFQIGTVKKKRF